MDYKKYVALSLFCGGGGVTFSSFLIKVGFTSAKVMIMAGIIVTGAGFLLMAILVGIQVFQSRQ